VATSDERVGHGRPRKYSYQSASRQMDVALEEAREKLKRVEAFQRSPGAAESSNEDVHVSNLSLFCMLCPFFFFLARISWIGIFLQSWISQIGIVCHQPLKDKWRILWAFQWSEVKVNCKSIASCDDAS
jgi:hypothetical protein